MRNIEDVASITFVTRYRWSRFVEACLWGLSGLTRGSLLPHRFGECTYNVFQSVHWHMRKIDGFGSCMWNYLLQFSRDILTIARSWWLAEWASFQGVGVTKITNEGNLTIVLRQELDLGDISSSFYSNASSMVRKNSYYYDHITDNTAKLTLMARILDHTLSSRSSWVTQDHSCLTHHIQFYPLSARLLGFSCWTAGGSTTSRDSTNSLYGH